ncbi:MAG: ribosome maturation factor RimM [Edaphobacter sp.]|uniref:ribosome maturation factor RimM n=1 Tax=Edaphobacter sp. TaxID=1934404 RepID=UPI002397E27F|nr:ribosome maturation factor RimM [Edaphobacter sp.]MDE1175223.1 ribosome maturation factor RimM [Edaphobacter sp.]
MTSRSNSWTVLARLLRPQGRKGEILADLLTDFPESIAGRTGLFLIPENFAGSSEEVRSIQVLSSWLPVGRNRGRVVLQLEGIDSIHAAEILAGLDLAVLEEERIALNDDASYVSDLVGCEVFDGDQRIGTVADIQFPASSTGIRLEDIPSLLEVRSESDQEILIPFVKAYLVSLDLPGRRIALRLPPGLVEVNAIGRQSDK